MHMLPLCLSKSVCLNIKTNITVGHITLHRYHLDAGNRLPNYERRRRDEG